MSTLELILVDVICLLLLAAATYLTRATPRRFIGALAGGLAATALGIGWDIVGHSLGWWSYVGPTGGHGSPLMYLAVGLWYGVGIALIGWRVRRRFGRKGVVAFLGVMAVYGPLRDYVGIALTRGTIQVISTGIAPAIGDATLWASCMAVGQGVMRLVAGPAAIDRLARCGWRAGERRHR